MIFNLRWLKEYFLISKGIEHFSEFHCGKIDISFWKKLYNLISFDICVHLKNYHHNQDNKCIHHPTTHTFSHDPLIPPCYSSLCILSVSLRQWLKYSVTKHYIVFFRTLYKWDINLSQIGNTTLYASLCLELLWDSSMWSHVPIVLSFLLLNTISWYEYITICLSIHQSITFGLFPVLSYYK